MVVSQTSQTQQSECQAVLTSRVSELPSSAGPNRSFSASGNRGGLGRAGAPSTGVVL